MAAAEPRHHDSLATVLVAGTRDALRSGEFERARILLALALRAELRDEERRILSACAGGHQTASRQLLLRLLALWKELAPLAEYEASTSQFKGREFAYGASDLEAEGQPAQPFPSWQKPGPDDAEALLAGSFFKRDAERAREDAAAGKSLMLSELSGTTSCDLLAVLVQLLLGAPFAPGGFAADMLRALLDSLRSEVGSAGVLNWTQVASLGDRELRRALRRGLADDFFYEADPLAAKSWRRARAARIHSVLHALLSSNHGEASLDWLRPMETWAALRALLALPGVTLPVGSALLLHELQRPLLPMCTNALLEARACGWIPPHAGAAAAFLHLHARLPADAVLLRTVYSCLCQHHAFRITRQAVVGTGAKASTLSAADVAYRERRAAMALSCPVRLLRDGGAQPSSEVESDDDDDDDDGADAGLQPQIASGGEAQPTFLLAHTADSPGARAPELPLEDIVREALDHHQLFPANGCTPLVMALRPIDAASAKAAAHALSACSLPLQQRKGEGFGLRYILDVPWSASDIYTAAALLGGAPEEAARALAEAKRAAGGEEDETTAAGPAYLGFGAHGESLVHLLAKTGRTGALQLLLAHVGAGDAAALVDLQGRSALHSAAAAGHASAVHALLDAGLQATATDVAGHTPMASAAAAGSVECVKRLLAAGADVTSTSGAPGLLELAAGAGAMDVCEVLLKTKADVNAQSASGRTALHAAARAGHLAVAKQLVDAGASLTLRDRTDRLAFEHLQDALARGEGQWLVSMSKLRSLRGGAPAARPDRPSAVPISLSSDAHFLS